MVDIYAVVVFGVQVLVASLALFLASGYFPRPVETAASGKEVRTWLVHLLWLSAAVLLIQSLALALGRLHWAPAVIAGGLALLAAPPLLQSLEQRIHNQTVLSGGLVLAILLLSGLDRIP